MKSDTKYWMIGVGVAFVLATAASIYMWPVWQTENLVNYAAHQADKHDHQTGETDGYDYWDNRILLLRENNQEANYIKYIAYSAGRDQVYNTEDDIVYSVKNRNWSKMAGEKAGEISTEAWEGFKETFKKDSRHDKE